MSTDQADHLALLAALFLIAPPLMLATKLLRSVGGGTAAAAHRFARGILYSLASQVVSTLLLCYWSLPNGGAASETTSRGCVARALLVSLCDECARWWYYRLALPPQQPTSRTTSFPAVVLFGVGFGMWKQVSEGVLLSLSQWLQACDHCLQNDEDHDVLVYPCYLDPCEIGKFIDNTPLGQVLTVLSVLSLSAVALHVALSLLVWHGYALAPPHDAVMWLVLAMVAHCLFDIVQYFVDQARWGGLQGQGCVACLVFVPACGMVVREYRHFHVHVTSERAAWPEANDDEGGATDDETDGTWCDPEHISSYQNPAQ